MLVLGNRNSRKKKNCPVPINKSESSSPAFPTKFEWNGMRSGGKERTEAFSKIIIHFVRKKKKDISEQLSLSTYKGKLDPTSPRVEKTSSARSFL